VNQIDAALNSVGPEAQKYVPNDLAAVMKEVTQVRTQLQNGDYAAVVAATPAILAKVQDLAPKAAAKKAEAMKTLAVEWDKLVVSVPADMDAVDAQAKAIVAAGKVPAGAAADALETAKTGVVAYRKFWEQALAAQAAGDIEKAVQIGNAIKRRMLALSVELGGSSS
jgi:hypothetical protein